MVSRQEAEARARKLAQREDQLRRAGALDDRAKENLSRRQEKIKQEVNQNARRLAQKEQEKRQEVINKLNEDPKKYLLSLPEEEQRALVEQFPQLSRVKRQVDNVERAEERFKAEDAKYDGLRERLREVERERAQTEPRSGERRRKDNQIKSLVAQIERQGGDRSKALRKLRIARGESVRSRREIAQDEGVPFADGGARDAQRRADAFARADEIKEKETSQGAQIIQGEQGFNNPITGEFVAQSRESAVASSSRELQRRQAGRKILLEGKNGETNNIQPSNASSRNSNNSIPEAKEKGTFSKDPRSETLGAQIASFIAGQEVNTFREGADIVAGDKGGVPTPREIALRFGAQGEGLRRPLNTLLEAGAESLTAFFPSVPKSREARDRIISGVGQVAKNRGISVEPDRQFAFDLATGVLLTGASTLKKLDTVLPPTTGKPTSEIRGTVITRNQQRVRGADAQPTKIGDSVAYDIEFKEGVRGGGNVETRIQQDYSGTITRTQTRGDKVYVTKINKGADKGEVTVFKNGEVIDQGTIDSAKFKTQVQNYNKIASTDVKRNTQGQGNILIQTAEREFAQQIQAQTGSGVAVTREKGLKISEAGKGSTENIRTILRTRRDFFGDIDTIQASRRQTEFNVNEVKLIAGDVNVDQASRMSSVNPNIAVIDRRTDLSNSFVRMGQDSRLRRAPEIENLFASEQVTDFVIFPEGFPASQSLDSASASRTGGTRSLSYVESLREEFNKNVPVRRLDSRTPAQTAQINNQASQSSQNVQIVRPIRLADQKNIQIVEPQLVNTPGRVQPVVAPQLNNQNLRSRSITNVSTTQSPQIVKPSEIITPTVRLNESQTPRQSATPRLTPIRSNTPAQSTINNLTVQQLLNVEQVNTQTPRATARSTPRTPRTPTVPRVQNIPRLNRVAPPVAPPPKKEEEKEKGGFFFEFRRGGKFIRAPGVFSSRRQAKASAIGKVSDTLSASFRIQKTKKKPDRRADLRNLAKAVNFRPSKLEPGVSVEKRNKRIKKKSKSRESKEIQRARRFGGRLV